MLLPADKLRQQRAGGTWSELFDYDWIQNRYPVVGLVIWYLFIFLLGLAVYPLTRLAMPRLADKGYPLSRALGLVLFGYLAWLGGSVGIPYTRLTIAIVFGLIVLAGGLLAYYQRDELRQEWQTSRKYFLMIEGLFLAFFVMDLIIRLGNPELWHPAKGGERPMDFSYFNAVIKSTVFPPYDPWFAGGYINYYYYGFVLVGTPVKLLGDCPVDCLQLHFADVICHGRRLRILCWMEFSRESKVKWSMMIDIRHLTWDPLPASRPPR